MGMSFRKNKASVLTAVLLAAQLSLLTACGDTAPDGGSEEMPSMTVYPSFNYLETTPPPETVSQETRSGQTYPDMTGTELATTYTDEFGNIYGITSVEELPDPVYSTDSSGYSVQSETTRDEFGVDLSDFPDVDLSEYYRNTDPANTFNFDIQTTASVRQTETSPVTTVPVTTAPPVVTTATEWITTAEETTTTSAASGFLSNEERVASRNAEIPSPYTSHDQAMHTYSYTSLTSTQKYVYDVITAACLEYEDKVTFDLSDKVTFEDLFIAYQTLYLDEVRLFYIDTLMEYVPDNATGYVLEMKLKYIYSKDRIASMQQEMNEKTEEILSAITSDMSDYEIVQYIHDQLIMRCTYTLSGSDITSPYGAIVKNKAQCQGYSRAFSYLCNLCGIETDIVLGVANEEHMWNMVKIDGKWYHVDLTWDDPDKKDYPDSVRYDYFCVTTDRMLEVRTIEGNSHELPVADSDDLEYYNYHGLVVSSVDEARELFLREAVKASETKASTVQFRCSSSEVYEEILSEFFTNDKADNILSLADRANESAVNKFNTDSIYHHTNLDTLIIKIFLNYR